MAQKPINLLIDDTKDEIINVLNSSGLPISILAMIMKDVNNLVTTQHQNTIVSERTSYLEELRKEKEEEENQNKKVKNSNK